MPSLYQHSLGPLIKARPKSENWLLTSITFCQVLDDPSSGVIFYFSGWKKFPFHFNQCEELPFKKINSYSLFSLN